MHRDIRFAQSNEFCRTPGSVTASAGKPSGSFSQMSRSMSAPASAATGWAEPALQGNCAPDLCKPESGGSAPCENPCCPSKCTYNSNNTVQLLVNKGQLVFFIDRGRVFVPGRAARTC